MVKKERRYQVKYKDGEVIGNLTFEESHELFHKQYEDGRQCVIFLQDTSYRPN